MGVMLTTYEAVLRGNLIEWRDDVPQQIADGQSVHVHVTVLHVPANAPATQTQEPRMAAALEKLAQAPTFASVDAQSWEREVRSDKP